MDLALHYFNEMKQKNILPTSNLYGFLISMYFKEGKKNFPFF